MGREDMSLPASWPGPQAQLHGVGLCPLRGPSSMLPRVGKDLEAVILVEKEAEKMQGWKRSGQGE